MLLEVQHIYLSPHGRIFPDRCLRKSRCCL